MFITLVMGAFQMKVIERKRLLTWAREDGFEGKGLDELTRYISDNYDGQIRWGQEPLDVEGSWKNVKAVEIRPTAGEDIQVMDDDVATEEMDDEDIDKMGDEDEEDVAKSAGRVQKRRSRGQIMIDMKRAESAKRRGPAVHGSTSHGAAFKRYQANIASGKAILPRAETAEVVGACFRLSAMGSKHYSQRDSDEDIAHKAGASYDNAAGGILIPDGYREELLEFKPVFGAGRQLCGVTPLDLPKETVPRLGDDVTVAYTGESSDSTESSPKFDGVELVTHEVTGLSYMPIRLIDKAAVDIADVLIRSHERSTMKFEDTAFFNGDGKQEGLADKVGSNSTLTVSGLTSLTGSGLGIEQVQEWISKLPSWVDEFADEIKITCTRAVDEQIFQRFESNAGGNTKEDLGVKPVRRYNGYEIVYNNTMARQFADQAIVAYIGVFPRACKFGELTGSQVFRQSEHVRFVQRQMAWQSAREFCVNPHNVDNTTGASGTNNVTESGVIALKVAS